LTENERAAVNRFIRRSARKLPRLFTRAKERLGEACKLLSARLREFATTGGEGLGLGRRQYGQRSRS
jgi:hypothetical protein